LTIVVLTDAELARLGQSGDIAALAVLLERYQARLHYLGVAMLGPGAENEDLVHDVFLVAVRALDSLRDLESAGSWLLGIGRNLCLQRLRERRELPLGVVGLREDPSLDARHDQILDALASADWVWAALADLSEPLRDVVVLRHFSSATSYQAIAAVLGVPVGTVRSRLSEGRRKLAVALQHEADRAHDDHAALLSARRAFVLAVNDEYNRGVGCERLAGALTPDAELTHAAVVDECFRGSAAIVRGLEGDLEAGMRLRVLDVIAGEGITVVEGAFENPSEAPDHCPPLTTQVFLHRGEQIHGIRLHYADGA
jgi:RNA polymerase sigma factor (sigma-70 family)